MRMISGVSLQPFDRQFERFQQAGCNDGFNCVHLVYSVVRLLWKAMALSFLIPSFSLRTFGNFPEWKTWLSNLQYVPSVRIALASVFFMSFLESFHLGSEKTHRLSKPNRP